MNPSERHGFILLEGIPALLLLVAVLMIAVRMTMIRAELEESLGNQALAGEAFPLVWQNWQTSGGRAALVKMNPQGAPEVFDLPDATWLPGESDSLNGIASAWRRIAVPGLAGGTSWLVEYRLSRPATWKCWTWIHAGMEGRDE